MPGPALKQKYLIYKITPKTPGRPPQVAELQLMLQRANSIINPYIKNLNVDGINIGMNTIGFSNGIKVEMFNYAVKSASGKAAVEIGLKTELQYLGRGGVKYLKGASKFGKVLGLAAIPMVVVDAAQKGKWENHHTADLVISVGSVFLLTGPAGWVIGGGYMIIDLGVKAQTGKSITENLFD